MAKATYLKDLLKAYETERIEAIHQTTLPVHHGITRRTDRNRRRHYGGSESGMT